LPGKAEVLRAILEREAARLPLNFKAVLRQDRRLHGDILRTFGRWDRALQAAGIDPGRVRRQRRWSQLAVIQRIRERMERGLPVNQGAICKDEPVLTSAGERYFACWDDALTAAGLDPTQVRRRGLEWTRESLVTAIRGLRDQGAPLNHGAVVRGPLSHAALHLFGSWDAALRAAGLNPDQIREKRRPYTREDVVTELRRRRMLAEAKGDLVTLPGPIRQAARRGFGSLEAAAQAAGVDPATIRRRGA
jgi:hypothetical protein